MSLVNDGVRLFVVCASATAGSVCATVTGFGIAIAFLMVFSLLSTALSLEWTTEERQWLVATTAVVSAGLLTFADRRIVPWAWVAQLLLPTLFTAPVGILTSLLLDSSVLLVGMGVLFFVVATQQLWDEWHAQRREAESRLGLAPLGGGRHTAGAWVAVPASWRERGMLLLTGAGAGYMGGLCAMPGPPLKVYVVARPLPGNLARGAVSAYLLFVYATNLLTLAAVRGPGGLLPFLVPLLPLLGCAVLGVLLGLKLGGGVLRLQPSASLMNVIIIGLLFASCTSMLRGGGEAAGGLGLTLALLALEAGWIGA
mmetsp:Transcript_15145/g.50277  ORF Transcript_15145/g.50277 Transcript_15145/m.50277 type:complete len:312 (+) Transcript_15145:158-1093(+)